MRSPIAAFIIIAISLLLDIYIFQAVKRVSRSASPKTKKVINIIYWLLAALVAITFFIFMFTDHSFLSKTFRTYLLAVAIGLFLSKLVVLIFLLIDDIRRLIQWVAGKLFSKNTEVDKMSGDEITRSTFLSWLGLAAGGTLFGSLVYGFSNKYNYQVKRIQLSYNNLPAAFKGLKIVHISDIHSGSFTDKEKVAHGVEMILKEKPDLILFTGDIVNDLPSEMDEYIDVFNKLRAPMGVFSTLGNHDYGDYVRWPDRDDAHRAKEVAADRHLLSPLQQESLDKVKAVHAKMGWRLLLDEHVTLKRGNDEIALLGVQNINGKGIQSLKERTGRFYSYGSLATAYAGAEKYLFKILMSHDPSHWDGEIRPKYADVDLTLSGHTHGMQFGVEIPGFKWSPVQYVYKQWHGLYEDGKQKLYVNPGYGFLGYPGRVGVLAEITVIELV